MKHDLILHIIRNPYGWADDEVRNARLVAAALIEQQGNQLKQAQKRIAELERLNLTFAQNEQQVELLRKLIHDIKAWDVDKFITLPLELRKRMQAVLTNAEQTGQ